MIRPQWEWALDGVDAGRLSEPLTPVFTAQYDAEQWLGEHWRELAAAGAARAVLLHDGIEAAPSVELRIP